MAGLSLPTSADPPVAQSKRNVAAVFALTLVLGWTVQGWIVSVVWALAKDNSSPSLGLSPPTDRTAHLRSKVSAHLGVTEDTGSLTESRRLWRVLFY